MGINIWWQKGYISRLVRSIVDVNEDTLLYSLNMLLPFLMTIFSEVKYFLGIALGGLIKLCTFFVL